MAWPWADMLFWPLRAGDGRFAGGDCRTGVTQGGATLALGWFVVAPSGRRQMSFHQSHTYRSSNSISCLVYSARSSS